LLRCFPQFCEWRSKEYGPIETLHKWNTRHCDVTPEKGVKSDSSITILRGVLLRNKKTDLPNAIERVCDHLRKCFQKAYLEQVVGDDMFFVAMKKLNAKAEKAVRRKQELKSVEESNF
jgi:hypothetical protein